MTTTKLIHWLLIAGVLALAWPGMARAEAQGDGPGTFEPAPCAFDLPDGTVEGEDIICGYVTVPERHVNPGGPAIRLAVAVIQSTSDDPAPDPLVVEAGGPGFSSLLAAPSLLILAGYRATRDLVIVEQRGIPDSEPGLICEEGIDLIAELYGQFLSDEDMQAREADALGTCYTTWTDQGVDLTAYNSLESAADFPVVMDALGYDQFNFYGASYAAALAQHLMRDYPDRLRAVILDAVVPLSQSYIAGLPYTVDSAFQRFFDACAADPACNEHFPNLDTIFFDLVHQYNASPVTMRLENPFTGEEIDAVITGESLIMSLYQQLYWTVGIPSLPARIYALAEGDTGSIREFVAPTRLSSLRNESGLYNSVICSEFMGEDTGDLPTEGAYPVVIRTMAAYADHTHVCAVWPVEPLPDSAHTPVISDIPTLIMSGEFDPVTPPEYGALVAETLSNSYEVVFPGIGHGSWSSSMCGLYIALDFVNDPTRAPETGCLDGLGVAFVIPRPPVVLTPFASREAGFSSVRPAGWFEVTPGVFLGSGVGAERSAFELLLLSGDVSRAEMFETWRQGMGLDIFPDSVGTLDAAGLTWELYSFEATTQIMGRVKVDMALADTPTGVYFIGLYAVPAEYETLHAGVFLPAVEAFTLLE